MTKKELVESILKDFDEIVERHAVGHEVCCIEEGRIKCRCGWDKYEKETHALISKAIDKTIQATEKAGRVEKKLLCHQDEKDEDTWTNLHDWWVDGGYGEYGCVRCRRCPAVVEAKDLFSREEIDQAISQQEAQLSKFKDL